MKSKIKVKKRKNPTDYLLFCITLISYTWEQLVETFLEFFEPYEDIDNAEPCKQIFDKDVAVHLNSLLNRIEIADEDESNKHIAYHGKLFLKLMEILTFIIHATN